MTGSDEEEMLVTGYPGRSHADDVFDSDTTTSSSEDFPIISEKHQTQSQITRYSEWRVVELSGHAPALDGLRGVAILFSIFDHLGATSSTSMVGHFGVSIFFVLSGFLISGILAHGAEKMRQGQSHYQYFTQFYAARAARLVPAQLVLVTFGCLHLAYFSTKKFEDGEIMHGAIRLLTSTEESSQTWKSPFGNTWSLAVEEWSYVFLSLLMPLLPSRIRWRFTAIILPIFSLLCLKAYLIYYPGRLTWSWQKELYLGFPPLNFDWVYGTPTNMWKIGAGAAARLLPWPQWCHRNKVLGQALVPILVGIVYANHIYLRPILQDEGLRSLILDPIVTMVAALIILTSLDGNYFLQIPFLQFCGRISYPWYLWQWPLINGAGWPHPWASIGVTAEAFLFAYFSTAYIEEPIVRRFRKWRETHSNRLPVSTIPPR